MRILKYALNYTRDFARLLINEAKKSNLRTLSKIENFWFIFSNMCLS